MKLVTLCSGGLDSVTLAHLLHSQGHEQVLLFVAYGQRHLNQELLGAIRCQVDLGLELTWANVSGPIFSSALTECSKEIPSGEYTPETLSTLVVPNRNAIFANLAAALAVSRGYDGIALAVHGGDHEIYSDCRPVFIASLRRFLEVSTGQKLHVHTPFVHRSKAQIVEIGMQLYVPFEHTWSCYKGGGKHCGICPTCRERQQAFYGYTDPTGYETPMTPGQIHKSLYEGKFK